MKEELNIIEVNEPEEFIELIKDQASHIMSKAYNELDKIQIVDTEEPDVLNRILMLKLLDEIKGLKHDLFSDTLETYNEILIEINKFRANYKNENYESELMKEYINGSMKRTIIISAGISVLLPTLIPLVLVYDIPKLGFDTMIKKYHTDRIEDNNLTNEMYESVQNPLFEYMDTLRSDYFSSIKKLNILEEKAINGENIISELKELINPENVGLELIEEKEKVLIKEKE